MPNLPIIPTYITVHLGPPDSDAPNVTVPFTDYIKNVASSEIYPTWPEEAIRANVYAQISYALNRIYTEYYRSRGYDFDITNSTAIDQSYVYGRDVFENISQIVDDIFNSYIVRSGSVEPYFTTYCDGRELRCEGLEQWGTVELANQGLTPYQILQHYYGNNIEIVDNAPVEDITESYSGYPLSLGSIGNDVKQIQVRLNRISKNYPSIPKISPVNGVFGESTRDAVEEFQRIFNLDVDGVVGRGTWYRIQAIYNAVKRLNELASEGITLQEISEAFNIDLSEGDMGEEVYELQYLLNFIGNYNEEIPSPAIDGIFGPSTRDAVIAFQRVYGLPQTGVVTFPVWEQLFSAYQGILSSLPADFFASVTLPYPGSVLRVGSYGEYVTALQEYLNYISDTYTEIPKVTVDGIFGDRTADAVLAYQRLFGIEPVGFVGAVTWNAITSTYRDLYDGSMSSDGQYPGYNLG